MDLKLSGSTAFVSGSTQGIGYAVAERCAAEGATVILNGRDQERTAAAAQRLLASRPGSRVSAAAADCSNSDQVAELLDRLGEVDILVNNVGHFDVAPFATISDDEWVRYFQVNTLSGVRLARGILPGMLDRGRGRIIFIGTESSVDVPADMIHYGASKAAALACANGLAKLTRGTDVTVNTVLGGPTYSDGVARAVEQIAATQSIAPEELAESLVRDASLLERFISPDEIANLVAFLASPLSSAINGAALRAEGGVLPTIV